MCSWAECSWLPGGVGSLAQVQVFICLGRCRVLTVAAHLQCGLKLENGLETAILYAKPLSLGNFQGYSQLISKIIA